MNVYACVLMWCGPEAALWFSRACAALELAEAAAARHLRDGEGL